MQQPGLAGRLALALGLGARGALLPCVGYPLLLTGAPRPWSALPLCFTYEVWLI